MARWTLAAVGAFFLFGAGVCSALDDKNSDKEALRKKILKKVEDRLKEESKRIMEEVAKILDEELKAMDEEPQPQPKKPHKVVKPTPPPDEDDPPEPKKPEPKKPEPKKPEPKKPAKAEPGYMGVYPEDLKEGMRTLLKLKEGEGVLIVGVAEDGPAAKAGVKANDIVLAVDGENVGSAEELREKVTAHKAGESVTLSIFRKKEHVDVKVKLAPRSDIAPDENGGGDEEGTEGDGEGNEGDEGDEGDEKNEKPAPHKPKVVFEPRAEQPKFDEKSAEELRDEIRKFLDEMKKEQSHGKTPKLVVPGRVVNIDDGDDEEGEEPQEEPKAKDPSEVRKLVKKFLGEFFDQLEKGKKEMPINPDEELQKMMDKFKELGGAEMEKLKEQLSGLMDEEKLKDLLQNLDPEKLQEQLQGLLGGLQSKGEDEEDLTKPDEKPDQPEQPVQPPPKAVPHKVAKAWLGVTPDEVTDEMKKQLKIDGGVLIRDVADESPAADAGLREGDVLLAIDDEEIAGPEDLQKFLVGAKPGADVTLTIMRKGKTIEKKVTLVERKKTAVPAKPSIASQPIDDGRDKKHGKKKKKPAARKATRRTERRATILNLGEDEEDGGGNPMMEQGLRFAGEQGLQFAILDKNGHVLFKAPIGDAQKMMNLANQFGFSAPGGKKSSGPSFSFSEPKGRKHGKGESEKRSSGRSGRARSGNLESLVERLHIDKSRLGKLQELMKRFEPRASGRKAPKTTKKTFEFRTGPRTQEWQAIPELKGAGEKQLKELFERLEKATKGRKGASGAIEKLEKRLNLEGDESEEREGKSHGKNHGKSEKREKNEKHEKHEKHHRMTVAA